MRNLLCCFGGLALFCDFSVASSFDPGKPQSVHPALLISLRLWVLQRDGLSKQNNDEPRRLSVSTPSEGPEGQPLI